MLVQDQVMLYKSFGREGFSILSEEFKMLEEDLGYVQLRDVSFVLFPERKERASVEDKKIVHAVIKGTLIHALPLGYTPKEEVVTLLHTLPEVSYNPHISDNFYLTNSTEAIFYAKDVYAFHNKIKVFR